MKISLKVIKVGYLGTNCSVVWDDDGMAAVIDPGEDADKLLAFMRQKELRCGCILLTHGHFDHIGAVAEIKEATNAKVFINKNDAKSLAIEPDILVEDGDVIVRGNISFKVLHTPGHTGGSVCYIAGDTMFSGDTLFCEDVGRTDLPGGNFAKLRESLLRLKQLPYNELRIIPGHEEQTTLSHEREHNPHMKNA